MQTNLKTMALVLVTIFVSVQAYATQRVHGYTKKNGTYVSSHHRTSPNHTQRDNWSSKGNRNPYTGTAGTRLPKK